MIQLPTANALDVERSVSAEMERLSRNFPPGVKYQVAFNTTDVVEESINEVLKTLAEAIALVVLVIFIFLQTWRSTIIPAVTIPVSLIGAFAFTKLMGFSINTLTLFGIILATGIVVDDAIVVIENIERHIQQYGKTARQAASDAMREVFGAVVATGLVLIAVFVPVAFFPGTTGRLYAQFSMTIAFAVALSVFNAITLTPALSALLLERESHHKGRFFSFFEKVIGAGTRGYVWGLGYAVAARWVVVLVFVGALGLTYWVYRTVPQAFIPEEDAGYFLVQVQAPAGASLEYTGNVARQAEKIILSDPDVLALFSVMGFSFSGAAPNQGLMFARLKPFDERPGPEHGVQAVLGRISGPLFGLPGAIVVGFAPPSIPGLSRFGGFEFQVLDQTGQDITNLAAATQTIARVGNQSGIVRGLFSSFTANDPQLQVTIDRQRALALGIPLSEITSAMQILLGSQYVNDFEFNNRAYRVYVQAEQQFRSNPQALHQLYARTRTGEMVPLEQVVSTEEVTAPQVINHFNLFRSATINGSAAPGVSSGVALAEMERLAETHLPEGMGYAWSGISLEETKAGRQAVFIFGLALLLVYLTLAAQVPRAWCCRSSCCWGCRSPFSGRWRTVEPGPGERRLLPGRPGDADWLVGEERHPDRGVRRTAPPAGDDHRRGRHRGVQAAAPADPDDLSGVHPGGPAARVRDRCRPGSAPFGRDRGGGRDVRVDLPEHPVHPGAVCGGPDHPIVGVENARNRGTTRINTGVFLTLFLIA